MLLKRCALPVHATVDARVGAGVSGLGTPPAQTGHQEATTGLESETDGCRSGVGKECGIRDAVETASDPGGGSELTAHEQSWFEQLVGGPEIVAWLEPEEHEHDDEKNPDGGAERL
jgi:hypothetical protein